MAALGDMLAALSTGRGLLIFVMVVCISKGPGHQCAVHSPEV